MLCNGRRYNVTNCKHVSHWESITCKCNGFLRRSLCLSDSVVITSWLKERTLERLSPAGTQACCVADFQVGCPPQQPAGLETRGTADLEVCATLNRYGLPALPSMRQLD